MASLSSPTPTTTNTVDEGGATTISAVHPDILQTHILTRLDGPTLASAACTCSQLHTLSSQENLWTNICNSTWPSTNTPRLRHVISTFPNGSRSFFSDSFPLLLTNSSDPTVTPSSSSINSNNQDRPSEIISAVDVYYKGRLIFSKVIETETLTSWFRCSPFRLDLLDPKDVVPTPIKYPEEGEEDKCRDLEEDLELSWILIDPIGRRAMNVSSQKPVSVQRHWLSGEVQVRFATILAGERGASSEFVQCGVVITCGGSQGGGLLVKEMSLQVEDMDGVHLNGKESLVILQRAMEGKKGIRRRREEEGRKRYQEFLERKKERKEKKLRTEGTLDMLCVAFGVLGFASFWLFVLCR
uniref:F-box domain-containing protein n=1 Tax=Fagus sylvatica TaxID=28930 RepID=A0A2N9EXI9_FAGSY